MPGPSLRALAVALPAAGVLGLFGCGGEDDYANDPRPPSPINVAAYVSPERVSVSPARFGAGPIVVVVTNQSNSSQEVTFETGEAGRKEVAQSTSPINPGDTGQLKLDLRQGTYVVKTGDDAIRPARVTVGPQRRSAQNELLQP